MIPQGFLKNSKIASFYSKTNVLLTANLIVMLILFLVLVMRPSSEPSASSIQPALSTETLRSNVRNPPNSIPAVFKCTSAERWSQVNYFRSKKEDWMSKFKLGCTEPVRLDSFLSLIWPLSERSVTLVNIGANKGYNLVRWWEAWSPKSGINSHTWGAQLKKLYPEYFDKYTLCGTCWYCGEKLFSVYHRDADLSESNGNAFRIIGIEPSQANFELLSNLKEWVNGTVIETYNYAASNESGEARFPITRLGSTTASLGDDRPSSKQEFKIVKIVTVDLLMTELGLTNIDYLIIDTEGYDPLVLRGAENSLSQGKISVIEFEYHGIGPWKSTSLKQTVEFLSDLQYDCYFKIPDGNLIRLTECFDGTYEIYFVSNVLCVHRGQTLVNEYFLSHCYWL